MPWAVHWEVLHDPVIIARLVLQVVLLIASSIFSMSETALLSLRDTDLDKLEQAGSPKARRLRALLDQPRQLIVSIICGNELINIAATVNLAGILLALFGNPQAAGLANTLLMLPLLLIFCEITPKTLAVTHPVPLATRLIEPIMTVWVRLVMPLRLVIHAAAERVTSLCVAGARHEHNILSADEFRTFLEDVEEEGVVTAAERRVISHLIAAETTKITEIMVPGPQVAFVDGDLSAPEIIERFRQLRHRRVPVYRERRDNILGVIKEEHVLDIIAKKPIEALTVEDLLAPPTLVPTTQTVSELAEFFKHGDHHAVIVVNEFGGVEGLVSADDVFGYLTRGRGVYLDAVDHIREPREGVFVAAGLTPLRAIRKAIHAPIDEASEATTVGGFVMSLLRRLPEPGDRVEDGGMTFLVMARRDLLIEKVLIAPQDHAALSTWRDWAEA